MERRTSLTNRFTHPETSPRDLHYILEVLEGCTPACEEDAFRVFCGKLQDVEMRRSQNKSCVLDFEDTPALGLPECRSVLFIRDCYFDLEDEIDMDINAIVGSPGIGKTMFMAFCLWRLARLCDVAVLCQLCGCYYAVVWRQGQKEQVWILTEDQAQDLANVKTCWFLADLHGSTEGRVYGSARMIVFTSPEYTKYNSLVVERSGNVCYMPPWTETELQDYVEAYDCAFYQGDGTFSSEDCIRERYYKYGGVPRIVLAPTRMSFITQTSFFEEALANVPVDVVEFIDIWGRTCNVLPEKLKDVSDRVFHCIPKQGSNYRYYNRELCSEQAKHEIVERFKDSNRQGTIDFVVNEKNDIRVHSFPGYLFEGVVRDVFTAKYGLCMHEFEQLEDLEELSHRLYYKPKSKNFGILDAFHLWTEGDQDGTTVVEMLQMTLAQTHHISAKSLSRVVEFFKGKRYCGIDLVLQYTFVVPKTSELASEQSFTRTNSPMPEEVVGVFDGVQQLRRTCSQREDGSLDVSDATPLAVGVPTFYNRPQAKRIRTNM